MKSIKARILSSFLLILIVTPLITLAVFNVVIRNYMDKGIETQLKNTVMTTQVLIKTELSETLYETDRDKVNQSLAELNSILRTSKIALNTELLLFRESGEMIYPIHYEDTFLDESLIGLIKTRLSGFSVEDAARIRAADGREFIVMGYKLTQLPISDIPYIVFISSMDIDDALFNTINIILITVMLAGIAVGTILSFRTANRVADPVKELCAAAEKIGERKEFTIASSSDIREIAQLSDSILMMSGRLEAYDKAQKAFLQNASHELKTPLMSIQGYAEGIEAGLFPDPQKAGAIIRDESQKLSRLVTELLILSRLDSQSYDREAEKATLNELIKEYLQRGEGVALKEKKTIRYCEEAKDLSIAYNEALFSQCFMNLLSNAIRYAANKVTVRISGTDREALIGVADDGEGLGEEDIPHLFERFYKGKNGQFGLGLAIAKSAAEAMGGTIRAGNLPEGGAEFLLSLPLWKD